MNVKKVLRSGSVTRYHSTMIDKKQTIDSHSWEAAIILMKIYPDYTKILMEHVLTHDCAEAATGDIPAPVKKEHPTIKDIFDGLEDDYMEKELNLQVYKLSKEETLAAKYADCLSGLYFTTARVRAGDQEAIPIRDNWLRYLGQLPYLNEIVEHVIEELKR